MINYPIRTKNEPLVSLKILGVLPFKHISVRVDTGCLEVIPKIRISHRQMYGPLKCGIFTSYAKKIAE